MVKHMNGDLLKSDCDYICHQVNCQGRMGSGIAKQIREKWPVVYENYMTKFEEVKKVALNTYAKYENGPDVSELLLGDIQIVGLWKDFYATNFHQSVINMFSQQHYGYDGHRYTSYDAFWNCLNKIKNYITKGSKIGFPKYIGCGLGGANWKVIETMIGEVLNNDFDVYIYEWKG